MGTRHFYSTEQKDSKIKWIKADEDTARKLTSAIAKQHGSALRGVAMFMELFFMTIPVVLLLAFAGFGYRQGIPMLVLIFCILFICAMLARQISQFKKHLPHYLPQKQSDIWIVRVKCSDVHTSGMTSSRDYYAAFNIAGGHVRVRIPREVYHANPAGKPYILYKFNARHGNAWQAIAEASLVDGEERMGSE